MGILCVVQLQGKHAADKSVQLCDPLRGLAGQR